MKPHYETLGVSEDADAAEIKRAYRKKAEIAHPDKKGGNQDEMVAINRAFDVLGDPKRRLLYDATGQDNDRPEEEQIRALIMEAFQDALVKDAGHVLNHAKKWLKTARDNAGENRDKCKAAAKELKRKRSKIKTKGKKPNFFHMILDKSISQAEAGIATFDAGIKICEKAMKEIDDYESSEDVLVQTPYARIQTADWPFGSATT